MASYSEEKEIDPKYNGKGRGVSNWRLLCLDDPKWDYSGELSIKDGNFYPILPFHALDGEMVFADFTRKKIATKMGYNTETRKPGEYEKKIISRAVEHVRSEWENLVLDEVEMDRRGKSKIFDLVRKRFSDELKKQVSKADVVYRAGGPLQRVKRKRAKSLTIRVIKTPKPRGRTLREP